MPAERTTMRHVREVLRLTTAGVALNEIAHRVGVAPSTVRLTLRRLGSAGLSWPLPDEMTDTALETAFFAAAGTKQRHSLLGDAPQNLIDPAERLFLCLISRRSSGAF